MNKEDLEKMTVEALREEAGKYPDEIKGADEMDKEQLIPALMEVLIIEEPKEEKKPAGQKGKVSPVGPTAVLKGKIRALKEERQKALEAKDYQAGALLRRRIHHLKRHTRKAAPAKLRAEAK
jgi:hypothetical protein